MFLLYNGHYQETDVPKDFNDQQILDALEKRKCFVGRQIGDFEIVSVEYDWGLRKQVTHSDISAYKQPIKAAFPEITDVDKALKEGLRNLVLAGILESIDDATYKKTYQFA